MTGVGVTGGTCPAGDPDCARTGGDIALGSHCTHWFPHGEVCCNCDAILPHGWWAAPVTPAAASPQDSR